MTNLTTTVVSRQPLLLAREQVERQVASLVWSWATWTVPGTIYDRVQEQTRDRILRVTFVLPVWPQQETS